MDGSCGVVGVPTVSASLGEHDAHPFVIRIMVDSAGGIAATADAGDEVVGIIAARLLLQLPFQLFRNNALHTRHQVRIRVRPHRRTDYVERVGRMTAPVADGFAAGIGERHVARPHGMHRRAEHLHTLYIRVLSFNVGSTHENLTLHTHQRTNCCGSHTMLTGTSLCDDARLAHAACQQNLSDSVVDLVRAGVVQVLALQEQTAAILLAHAPCLVERRRAAHIVFQQLAVFLLEFLRLYDWQVLFLQRFHRGIENFRHIRSTESPIEPIFIYLEFVLLCHF